MMAAMRQQRGGRAAPGGGVVFAVDLGRTTVRFPVDRQVTAGPASTRRTITRRMITRRTITRGASTRWAIASWPTGSTVTSSTTASPSIASSMIAERSAVARTETTVVISLAETGWFAA